MSWLVPRQRHWSNRGLHPVPLTRHAFERERETRGCSQKTLAPLATFLSRYRGVVTSNLKMQLRRQLRREATRYTRAEARRTSVPSMFDRSEVKVFYQPDGGEG